MDQILSQLIPTQRIGSDGFSWWVGQVEGTAADEKNNKGGYRFKVRIVGDHPKSKEILIRKIAMGKCDDASQCTLHAW